ncbi:MAG: T9SS type A sorting domain-containing protein [Bacteroidetes bacterium]|nr:T9SS type A sorting domain-containing protein [Bacteroidota bacterium]MCB9226409.1 T9SS type A sorting domain-containing protein [Chitinophagales bacterium]
MRKQLFFWFILFIGFYSLSAQVVEDSVIMGPNYTNDVFYSLSSGNTTEVGGADWTVAFYNESISAAIMINSGRGVKLYRVSDDISTFSDVLDTANLSNWDELYDDYSTWSEFSAFEDMSTTSSSNYGWGEYNSANHQVTASRIFVIQTVNGDFYKVMVVSKITGTFTYRYATLDNSIDTTLTITPADYLNTNYAYLNMDNHTLLNLEPNNTTWDLVFKKYNAQYSPTVHYPVTGVLNNFGVEIAKVENLPNSEASYDGLVLSPDRNTIGWDWKSFNNTTYTYDLTDSLTYFVKTIDNKIYKLYFTEFAGGSTGVIKFNKEEIAQDTTNINDINSIVNYTIYPNPTKGQIELVLDLNANENLQIAVSDMFGRTVYQSNSINANAGLNAYRLDLSNNTAGVYLIQLSNGKNITTQKVILNK